MLSLGKLASAGAASAYYEADDYYCLGSAGEDKVWTGEGAEALGLRGEIDADDFKNVLNGQGPDGSALGQLKSGPNRQLGWDATFSPPKSVSVMALAVKDEALTDAFTKSVETALSVAERFVSVTRGSQNGSVKSERTGNLIIAKFRHYLSREQDPQLHIHCVIANATQRGDGEWRALDSRPLYKMSTLMGMVQNHELAKSANALGYHVERTGKYGSFELKGVPEDVVDRFSTRREQIVNHVAQAEHDTPKSRGRSALQTRKAKHAAQRGEIEADWDAKLGADGPTLNALLSQARRHRSKGTPAQMPKAESADDLASFAIAHLSERQATFEFQDLFKAALDKGFGTVDIKDLLRAFDKRQRSGELIVSQVGPKLLATSSEMVGVEQRIDELVKSANARRRKTLVPGDISKACDAIAIGQGTAHLSDEQKSAVSIIAGHTGRVAAIQGDAGTGKTYAVKTAASLLKWRGLDLLALAPTHAARRELTKTGLSAQTVQSFLTQKEDTRSLRKTVVVIDEASMVGSRQMLHLLERFEANRPARIVFMGDTKQLESIEAGQAFKTLLKDVESASLKDIKRQTKKEYLQAVKHTAAGDFKAGFSAIAPQIREADRSQLMEASLNVWLEVRDRRGQAPLMMTATHAVREAFTRNLRPHLRKEGTLGSKDKFIRIDKVRSMTKAERRRADAYQAGDHIRFLSASPAQKIESGTAWVVKQSIASESALLLSDPETLETRSFKLGGRGRPPLLSVSQPNFIPVAKGESLRFAKSLPKHGITAGDTCTLISVTDTHLTLKDETGTARRLERNSPEARSLDYAYIVTTHAAQGQTAMAAIAIVDTRKAMSLDAKQTYVQMSRGREAFILLTDDKERLLEHLSEQDTDLTAQDLAELVHSAKQTETLYYSRSEAEEPAIEDKKDSAAAKIDVEPVRERSRGDFGR